MVCDLLTDAVLWYLTRSFRESNLTTQRKYFPAPSRNTLKCWTWSANLYIKFHTTQLVNNQFWQIIKKLEIKNRFQKWRRYRLSYKTKADQYKSGKQKTASQKSKISKVTLFTLLHFQRVWDLSVKMMPMKFCLQMIINATFMNPRQLCRN